MLGGTEFAGPGSWGYKINFFVDEAMPSTKIRLKCTGVDSWPG